VAQSAKSQDPINDLILSIQSRIHAVFRVTRVIYVGSFAIRSAWVWSSETHVGYTDFLNPTIGYLCYYSRILSTFGLL